MKYEDECFIIYYNVCDERYLEHLVKTLKSKMGNILDFFGIQLKDKIVIKLYDKKDKYKTNLERSFNRDGMGRRYHEWMIADTEDGNINMLSLDIVCNIEGFENYTEDEFCLNACHEFVHLCQDVFNTMSPGWFWEVLATYLGNPECQKETEEEFTLDDLENHFDEIDGYGAVYKVANYLFSNYDREFIVSLIKDIGKLYKVMEEYFNSKKLT